MSGNDRFQKLQKRILLCESGKIRQFCTGKKIHSKFKKQEDGWKNWKSVNKVHTDTPLLGYTKIRNTDISVAALIAVSKRRKTHPQERLTTTPQSSLFESEMTHSHHILSFVQKSGDAPHRSNIPYCLFQLILDENACLPRLIPIVILLQQNFS